jgi:hypothetical protein
MAVCRYAELKLLVAETAVRGGADAADSYREPCGWEKSRFLTAAVKISA